LQPETRKKNGDAWWKRILTPQENKNCYLSVVQREVLLQLLTEPTIEQCFFLTGGTALAVCYLSHRVSNNLDLFTIQSIVANKLCAWVSPTEPKDFIDLYTIVKILPAIRFGMIYIGAQAKDAVSC
jgi:predicted nucleotidyltransferase component of viral defense system